MSVKTSIGSELSPLWVQSAALRLVPSTYYPLTSLITSLFTSGDNPYWSRNRSGLGTMNHKRSCREIVWYRFFSHCILPTRAQKQWGCLLSGFEPVPHTSSYCSPKKKTDVNKNLIWRVLCMKLETSVHTGMSFCILQHASTITFWSRSSYKYYLKLQFLPQSKQSTFTLQSSVVYCCLVK